MSIKKLIITLIICTILIPLTAKQKMSFQAKAKFKGAKVHLSSGRTEKALKYFNEVLEMQPTNIETANLIAGIYYDKEKDYKKALEFYQLAEKNINIEIENYKGLIETDAKHADDHQEEIDELVKLLVDNEKFQKSCWGRLFNTGLTQFKAEKYEEAFAEFTLLYEMDSKQKKICKMLARISKKLEKNEDVIRYYLESYELDNTDIEAIKELAFFYYTKENYDKSVEWYNKAIEIEPQNSDLLNNLAVVYKKLGLEDKEIQLYEKVIELEPENKAVIGNIGNYYARKSNNEKAVEYFIKLLNLAENDNNYKIVCTYLARMQNFKELAKYSKKWLEFNPENANAKQMYNYSKDK